jgi:opacity protein-like surface antigen
MIVGRAKQGQVLAFEKKTGDWYLVALPPDDTGNVVTGFIHSSVVEEVGAEGAAPVAAEEKPGPKAEAKPEAKKVSPPPAGERKASPRNVPLTSQPAFRRLYVRVGGGYGLNSSSFGTDWGFDYYHEQGYVHEAYDLDADGIAVDVGLGFLFTPNLGLEASFIPASGDIAGMFEAGFPHPFYFDQFRVAAWQEGNLRYGANEVNLDIIGRIPISRRLAAYVTAGGTYFLGVKIDTLGQLGYDEIGYPYTEISVTPQYVTSQKSTFGFNGGAGVDFFLTDVFGVNLNARYSAGTAKIAAEGVTYEVKAGGIRATAGLKIAF